VRAEGLKKGNVLDDSSPGSQYLIRQAYKNCYTRQDGMYQKVREVADVRVARKYVYVTMACNSIVKCTRETEVEVL
jgi:alpha-D-ribose 1-methylphosphonate 5-triphosphate diphosphatase PhnM